MAGTIEAKPFAARLAALSDQPLHQRHAPKREDFSLEKVERVGRVEAMDELKRAIDVADDLPYALLFLHIGGSREMADPAIARDFSPRASNSARPSCGRHDLCGEHHQ